MLIVLIDEITGICQPIPEEHNTNKKSCFRAKFYKFYDNRRPPYYGTWRKHSQQITARRPFARDEVNFLELNKASFRIQLIYLINLQICRRFLNMM